MVLCKGKQSLYPCQYFDQELNKMTRLALEPRLQRTNHQAITCSTKYLVGG